MRGSCLVLLPLIGSLLASAGCSVFEREPILNAMSYDEQVREIKRLVPKGTPRKLAVQRLKKAGIVGDFAEMRYQTLYHCEIWNHPDGHRYHMFVTLQFDDKGLVEGVGETDTPTPPDRRPNTTQPAGRSTSYPRSRLLPIQRPTARGHDQRNRPRRPFADEP